MIRRFVGVALLIAAALFCSLPVSAQPKLPRPGGGESNRLPNDQVEGTIYEYYSTDKKTDEKKELRGKFRLEESAIFAVGGTFKLPSKKEVEKKVVEPLRRGEAIDLPLPEGAQQKRLGEYRKLSDGRLRLDLNDKESLNGLMILRPKKDARDVWIGTYQEKKDGKVVGEWNIEVRPIED